MAHADDERRFTTWVHTAADSPEELRRCDVDRVVGYAADSGLADLGNFCQWLVEQRPDLAEEIEAAKVEIEADMAGDRDIFVPKP